MSDLNQFISQIPKITRFLTITTLTASFLNVLKILPSSYLICDWGLVLEKFQIWRVLTGFLVINPQPMQGLMDTYMLYSYSRGIEEFKFFNNSIDYLFYFFIIIPLIIISSLLLPIPLLQQALLGSLTYTWSRSNKDHQVSIYFISIKASLLPIVTLGFRLLLEGNIAFLAVLTGMSSAYVYSCIELWNLGPLYTYFCETFGIRVENVNRLGTLNQVEETTMRAPLWFKSICEKFVKVKTKKETNKIHTLSSTNSGARTSSSDTSSAISSGSLFGNARFQGKGYRLGSD